MSTYRIHMFLSVRGAIRNKMFKDFTNDDGTPATSAQAFDFLCDQLALGHEVIPSGDCDDFDWKTGCRGHVIEDALPLASVPAEGARQ